MYNSLIDNIDVSQCEHFIFAGISIRCSLKFGDKRQKWCCKDNPNCEFKKMKKEQK